MKKPGAGFVYAMGGDKGDIKIGISIDPARRLQGVRAEYPGDFKVIATWFHSWPFGVEQEAHKILKEHRTIGEWFSVSKYDAFDAVVRAMRKIDESPAAFPIEQQLEQIKTEVSEPLPLPPPAEPSDRYLIGYVRALKKASYAAQFQWMRSSGVPEERIYIEKEADRLDAMDLMLRDCRDGDAILVWSTDVFGAEAESIMREIETKGAIAICADLKARRRRLQDA